MIEIKNLNFKYNSSKNNVLENINFKINEGEIVLISGNSGSGKSTLLNIINGIIPEIVEGVLSGEILINGDQNLKMYERGLILGNIFQNPRSQFFTTNTTSELVFALENYGFSYEAMHEKLTEITSKFKIDNLLNRNIFTLSSGERQFLALLNALILNPKVVLFDEPSANLDYGNSMRLRKEILDLKQDGKTVIVSDHRFFYLKDIIDKVILIDNGNSIFFNTEEEYFDYEYGKRAFNIFESNYPVRKINMSRQKIISIKNLSYKNILKNINVDIMKNEITTIVGVNGSGKTTLAKLLSGVIKQDNGYIDIKSNPLYIMQDADFQLFGSSVINELEITEKDENKNIEALKLLNLYELKNKHPQSLSGGEKQRLQMAISLISKDDIIILDEPTSGLDKLSMHKVIDMINILQKSHNIILISHDYEFIRNVTDKVLYLSEGEIKAEFYLEENNIYKLNNIFKQMEEFYE